MPSAEYRTGNVAINFLRRQGPVSLFTIFTAKS